MTPLGTAGPAPLLSVDGLIKRYKALRPLRIQSLAVTSGEVISLLGLDAEAAEMLIGLLTGAVLPDEGEIKLFGRSTRDVADSDAWLAMLDGVGIVTDRAVLVGQFSVEQNVAMPFTLQVDPMSDDTRTQARRVSDAAGLDPSALAQPVATAPPDVQARVRLARALALDPTLLFVEHASATLPREAVAGFAADLARTAKARNLAILSITADEAFASALGGRQLHLEPASGALRERSGWRKIFG